MIEIDVFNGSRKFSRKSCLKVFLGVQRKSVVLHHMDKSLEFLVLIVVGRGTDVCFYCLH